MPPRSLKGFEKATRGSRLPCLEGRLINLDLLGKLASTVATISLLIYPADKTADPFLAEQLESCRDQSALL